MEHTGSACGSKAVEGEKPNKAGGTKRKVSWAQPEGKTKSAVAWSRDSFQLTLSEPATCISCLDQLESMLISDGEATWNERSLIDSLRAAQTFDQSAREELPSVASTPIQSDPPLQTSSPTLHVMHSQEDSLVTNSADRLPSQPSTSKQGQPEDALSQFVEQDNVVIFGTGTLSPWNSDEDSQELSKTVPEQKQEKDPAGDEARKEILEQGPVLGIPLKTRTVVPSIHLLTDKFLRNWSDKDPKCVVAQRSYPTLRGWVEEVRSQRLAFHLPITVVALQCLKQIECLEPLKNGLGGLCRAIRTVNPGGRIFVTTNVPNPRLAKVLGLRTRDHNRLIRQAVMGINPKLKRVFVCAMEEHFFSGGEYIQPIDTYFNENGELTTTGCFVYRSCMFREVGIIPYHMR